MKQIDLKEDPYWAGMVFMMGLWIVISYRLVSPGFLYPVLTVAVTVVLSKKKKARVAVPPRLWAT